MIDLETNHPRVRFASMFILTITWCFYAIPYITLNNEECATYTGKYCNSTYIIRFIDGCEQIGLEDYTFKCEGYMKVRGRNSTCNILNDCVKDGYTIDNSRLENIDLSDSIIIYIYPVVILLICITRRVIIVYISDVSFDILLFLLTFRNTPFWLIIPCCIITLICGLIQIFNSDEKIILIATIIQSLLDIIIGIYIFLASLTVPFNNNVNGNLILIPLGFACIEHAVVYIVSNNNKDKYNVNMNEYSFN